MNIELFVALIVPDNTALTAFRTLHAMSFASVTELKRFDYYCVDATTDIFDRLATADILVNANKHRAVRNISLKKDQALIIVKDCDNPGAGVLHTLTNRLGLQGIKHVVKGVAWVVTVNGNRKDIAKKITEQLLMNEHFQEAEYRF